MKIVHNQDNHQITFLDERYYFDNKNGEYYPSATTILDVYPKGFGFQQWLKDLGSNADQVLKRAQEQGTNIHNAIEGFLNGEEIKWYEKEKQNYTIEEWLMILKFYDFYKTFKPKPLAVEPSLVSHELGFGGTLDLVCTLPDFPDDIWYIDWKSGGAIYKTNKIQAAAYQELWNSLEKKKITRLGCFHLKARTRGPDKSGKCIQGEGWKLEEVDDPKRYFKLFKHTQVIWKEENPNPKPKNLIYPDRIRAKGLK